MNFIWDPWYCFVYFVVLNWPTNQDVYHFIIVHHFVHHSIYDSRARSWWNVGAIPLLQGYLLLKLRKPYNRTSLMKSQSLVIHEIPVAVALSFLNKPGITWRGPTVKWRNWKQTVMYHKMKCCSVYYRFMYDFTSSCIIYNFINIYSSDQANNFYLQYVNYIITCYVNFITLDILYG